MEKNKKIMAATGVLGGLAALLLLLRKKVGAAMGAAVSIRVLDALGNEVPHNSATELEPGGSYTIEAIVTNLSTHSGQPVEAVLTTNIRAMADGTTLMETASTNTHGPGVGIRLTTQFNVPSDITATSGAISATVFDPNGNQLATATLPITIIVLPINRPAINGMGDLNDDGYVTEEDAQILAAYITGFDISSRSPLSMWEFVRRADLNCDGNFTATDMTAIENLIAYGTLPSPAIGKRAAVNGMGDLNNDGYVSSVDMILCGLLMGGFPASEVSPLSEAELMRRADLNGDGEIDLLDIMLIRDFIFTGELPQPKRLPPCGNYGDVDGDGWVTNADARMIADYLVGLITLTAEQLRRADVTGNGQVTITDALAIGQYIEGIIDNFPVCHLPPPQTVYAASVEVGIT